MAARAGMADIIKELRVLTDANQEDVTIDGVAYWTDDQLQTVLDEFRLDIIDVELISASMMVNGVREWTRYYFPDGIGRFIETAATTGAFSVVNSIGEAAPAYTVDYLNKLVTFTVSTGGLSYFIRGRTFDVKSAAAKVWMLKAGHRVNLIKWQAGNQKLEEDIEWSHCMEMYRLYSGFKGIKVIKLNRVGYNGSAFS